jgi:hypothetical protein
MDKNASIESMAIMFENDSSCLSSMSWNDNQDVVHSMKDLYEILEAAEEIVSEAPWLRTTIPGGPSRLGPWESGNPVDSRLDGPDTFPVGGADLSNMQADVVRSSSTLCDPITSECHEGSSRHDSDKGGSCPKDSEDSSTIVASAGCVASVRPSRKNGNSS